MKKDWNEPKLNIIGIQRTEAGNGPIKIPDASYTDDDKTWYSFPDDDS